MDIGSIKALTFDTGGTILDWHTGFSEALKKAGEINIVLMRIGEKLPTS